MKIPAMGGGGFDGIGTEITRSSGAVSSINYTATEDCWINFQVMMGAMTQSAIIKIDNKQVGIYYLASGSQYSAGLYPLKKGQTITADAVSGVQYAYWVYALS